MGKNKGTPEFAFRGKSNMYGLYKYETTARKQWHRPGPCQGELAMRDMDVVCKKCGETVLRHEEAKETVTENQDA